VAKFLLTYHSPGGGGLAATPEEQAKSMAAWTAWFGQLGSALVDGGNPVGAAKTVSANGSASDTGNGKATGYSIINVNSIEEAVEASQMCPVLENRGSVESGSCSRSCSRASAPHHPSASSVRRRRALSRPACCYGSPMRRLIVTDFLTLDGDVEAPGMEEHSSGRNAWALHVTDDELGRHNQNQVYAADAILLGRRT
jgi:hypothetical protein